jgi:cellulose synthase/poly-beta-1,6-N-acetylglucosamine synthase-like glycosyltransferase
MKATIVISSFKEPSLSKAVEKAISQKTDFPYDILVVSPDKNAEELVKRYKKSFKAINFLKDPGKGKSFGLNLAFKKLKSDIWVFTDGDVYFDENALSNIISSFSSEKVGCACGRIVPINSKKNMLGYWAHLLADAGAHKTRKKFSDKEKFLECSGYLFAVRKGLVSSIPLNVAEDSYIPYIVFQKGYKIRYSPNSIVYVKNPTTLRDFIRQRVRTAKAHTSLTQYFRSFPKMKSFKNEIKEGTFSALKYPNTFKEFFWTILLFFARLYIWIKVFYEERIIGTYYGDGWKKVESTK